MGFSAAADVDDSPEPVIKVGDAVFLGRCISKEQLVAAWESRPELKFERIRKRKAAAIGGVSIPLYRLYNKVQALGGPKVTKSCLFTHG